MAIPQYSFAKVRITVAEVPNGEIGRMFLNRLEAAMGPVHTLHPVDGGGAQGAAVWHAVLSSGEHVAVKRHAHAGAGEVEFGVLQMLLPTWHAGSTTIAVDSAAAHIDH